VGIRVNCVAPGFFRSEINNEDDELGSGAAVATAISRAVAVRAGGRFVVSWMWAPEGATHVTTSH
jgi:NAD(P)-dependent dehydrogenase (short-subunit alcohol dehydrogenase family)